jgi:hypothetical protein
VTAVWSAHDTIVAPQDNGRLSGAREIALGGLGHMAMAFSPRILAILLDELAREEQAPPTRAGAKRLTRSRGFRHQKCKPRSNCVKAI